MYLNTYKIYVRKLSAHHRPRHCHASAFLPLLLPVETRFFRAVPKSLSRFRRRHRCRRMNPMTDVPI